MSQINGVSLKKTFSKAVAFGASLLMMTGVVGSASADFNACSYDPCCPIDCCEMPDYVLYADFIYWQANPEGLEFARLGGFGGLNTPVKGRACIFGNNCEFKPGFRVGGIVDLKCSNWDFYAQYTNLSSSFSNTVTSDQSNLFPLINTIGGMSSVNLARSNWSSDLNVLDFGLGRTFEVNSCFNFRPHIGFKATWQDLKFDIRYERDDQGETRIFLSHNKINFDGIGLRGGFDASWRFSPCFSIMGGFAASAIYSDLCIVREDFNTPTEGSVVGPNNQNKNVKYDHCVLAPVMELLLGLRWDSRVCNCYDVFVFVGWENQVWWDLNRFIMVTDFDENSFIEHGPHGNITYQGLTVRGGLGF